MGVCGQGWALVGPSAYHWMVLKPLEAEQGHSKKQAATAGREVPPTENAVF